MIYARHNAVENWKNAVGSKDEVMRNDMLLDEIAKVIIDKKHEVIQILKKNNVFVPPDVTQIKLAGILAKNIPDNTNLKKDIVNSITEHNIYLNNDGSGNKSAVSQVMQDQNVQALMIMGLTAMFNKKDKDASSDNQKLLEERIRMQKLEKAKTYKPVKKIKWGYIIGGTILIGATVFVAIYLAKRYALKKAGKKMEQGGSVEVEETTVSTEAPVNTEVHSTEPPQVISPIVENNHE